jgi:hypothetical protein
MMYMWVCAHIQANFHIWQWNLLWSDVIQWVHWSSWMPRYKQTRNSIQHKHMGRYAEKEIDLQQQPAWQTWQYQIFLRSNTGQKMYQRKHKLTITAKYIVVCHKWVTTVPDLWPAHVHSKRYMSRLHLRHPPCTSQLDSATSEAEKRKKRKAEQLNVSVSSTNPMASKQQ